MRKRSGIRVVFAAVGLAAMCCAILTTVSCSKGSSKKVLRVAMECAYAPFNWTQPTDVNGAVKIADNSAYAYGYDVMMAKKIAASLGREVSVVKMEWNGLIPAVQSGKIDAIVAGMCMTPERIQAVDFSSMYYDASLVVLTMGKSKYANAKSLKDLSGATMTSQLNTVWYNILSQVPNAKLLPGLEGVPDLLVALTSGKIDAYTADLPTAMAVVYANPDVKLLDFAGGDGFKVEPGDTQMGIAVKKGNKELLDGINKALAGISEADRAAFMQDAIKMQPLAQ
jgi:putative lysine transport system substrate-binding protein